MKTGFYLDQKTRVYMKTQLKTGFRKIRYPVSSKSTICPIPICLRVNTTFKIALFMRPFKLRFFGCPGGKGNSVTLPPHGTDFVEENGN